MLAARQNPSIRAAGAAAALALLAAAGCASSPTAAAPAGALASGTGQADTSDAAGGGGSLSGRLLDATDMPSGWTIDASATNPAMTTPCTLLNSALWNAKLPAKAERDLDGGLAGPYLDEQFGEGTAKDADAAWQTLVDGISKCTTYTHGGSSGASTFTIAKAPSFPAYGDGSYAFTLAIEITGGVSASGNIVAVRAGNSIVVLYLVGLTAVDKSVVDQAVTKAVVKART